MGGPTCPTPCSEPPLLVVPPGEPLRAEWPLLGEGEALAAWRERLVAPASASCRSRACTCGPAAVGALARVGQGCGAARRAQLIWPPKTGNGPQQRQRGRHCSGSGRGEAAPGGCEPHQPPRCPPAAAGRPRQPRPGAAAWRTPAGRTQHRRAWRTHNRCRAQPCTRQCRLHDPSRAGKDAAGCSRLRGAAAWLPCHPIKLAGAGAFTALPCTLGKPPSGAGHACRSTCRLRAASAAAIPARKSSDTAPMSASWCCKVSTCSRCAASAVAIAPCSATVAAPACASWACEAGGDTGRHRARGVGEGLADRPDG